MCPNYFSVAAYVALCNVLGDLSCKAITRHIARIVTIKFQGVINAAPRIIWLHSVFQRVSRVKSRVKLILYTGVNFFRSC